jgi:NAD(P)-dependent dehydrogenase (short-subunit alcohol dehydrogenase family)
VAIADVSDRSLVDLFSLKDRVAVVTGAARGLGAQIVRRLVEAGADVVAADIDLVGLEALMTEIRTDSSTSNGLATGRVLGVLLDVTDTATLMAAAERAVSEFGSLDIWINNAGIFPTSGAVLDVTDDFIDRMLAVNTRGTFAGAREAARRMINGGVIINMASTAGLKASLGISAYVASKHAVVGLTKALALELGPRNIRVLGIAPTVIDTPGVRNELEPLRASGLDIEARLSANPLGRVGVPDDIARVVVFCCSDLASYMTGSIVAVDAGSLV